MHSLYYLTIQFFDALSPSIHKSVEFFNAIYPFKVFFLFGCAIKNLCIWVAFKDFGLHSSLLRFRSRNELCAAPPCSDDFLCYIIYGSFGLFLFSKYIHSPSVWQAAIAFISTKLAASNVAMTVIPASISVTVVRRAVSTVTIALAVMRLFLRT